MSAASTPAAPPWLDESFPESVVLAKVIDDGLVPGTVLERSSTGAWFAWDGFGEPASGVLLENVTPRVARVIVRDAVLIGRHMRSGAPARRGCKLEARRDLWMTGIRVR